MPAPAVNGSLDGAIAVRPAGVPVMSVALTCPNCDSTFTVDDGLVGKRIHCPACRAPVGPSDDAVPAVPSRRGSWVVAGVAGILAAAALLFAALSYSRARSFAENLAAADRRAEAAAADAAEFKARLADVEQRAREAVAGREDFQARLAATERKADAAVAARNDLTTHHTAVPAPAVVLEAKNGAARKGGTATFPKGRKRDFATISGGRFTGPGRADAIQRVAGEIVLYPAAESFKEILVPVDAIRTLSVGPRLEKDPDADDDERLFAVQVAGINGQQQSWKVEAPLTVYVHWADGFVIEQFLNRDLLGMTFAFDTPAAKAK